MLLLKQFVRDRNALKPEQEVSKLIEDITQDKVPIDRHIWTKTIDRMYNEEHCTILRQNIKETARMN